MSVALGVLAAASTLAMPPPALPALPAQGLVVAEPRGITFVSVSGRRLGHIGGMRLAGQDTNLSGGLPRLRDRSGHVWRIDFEKRRLVPADAGTPLFGGASLAFRRQARTWVVQRAGRVVLRMRVGREFPFPSEDGDIVSTGRRALDLRSGRLVAVPVGCSVASRRAPHWILLCGRIASGTLLPTSIEELVNGRRRRIAGAPVRRASDGRIHGHWTYAMVAPDRRRLLAQWSGECEVPTAFLIEGGRVRSVGRSADGSVPESAALGWLRDGSAVIHFPVGACGGSLRTPGAYALSRSGKPRLLLATSRLTFVAMWGG